MMETVALSGGGVQLKSDSFEFKNLSRGNENEKS